MRARIHWLDTILILQRLGDKHSNFPFNRFLLIITWFRNCFDLRIAIGGFIDDKIS